MLILLGHASLWALLFLAFTLRNVILKPLIALLAVGVKEGPITLNVFSWLFVSLLLGTLSFLVHTGLWANLKP